MLVGHDAFIASRSGSLHSADSGGPGREQEFLSKPTGPRTKLGQSAALEILAIWRKLNSDK